MSIFATFLIIYIISVFTLSLFDKFLNAKNILKEYGQEFYNFWTILIYAPFLNTVLSLLIIIDLFFNKKTW